MEWWYVCLFAKFIFFLLFLYFLVFFVGILLFLLFLGMAIYRDKKWRADILPCDCEILMGIFCEYMDTVFCPAFRFSEKNFIECKLYQMENLKALGKYFKDIAIVQVIDEIHESRHNKNIHYSRKNINKISDCDSTTQQFSNI